MSLSHWKVLTKCSVLKFNIFLCGIFFSLPIKSNLQKIVKIVRPINWRWQLQKCEKILFVSNVEKVILQSTDLFSVTFEGFFRLKCKLHVHMQHSFLQFFSIPNDLKLLKSDGFFKFVWVARAQNGRDRENC